MPHFARMRATEDPTGLALVDPAQTLGWSDVDVLLNQTANRLLGTDLGPKHRVAVFAENAAETALAHLGALLAGASSVPVNFHLNAKEVAYILEDADVALVFVDRHTFDRGCEAAETAGVPVVVGWGLDEPHSGILSWDEWLADADETDPPLDIVPRANLLYTSGTTGRPKGTELPPSMFAGGRTVAEHLDALARGPMADVGPHLVVGPMYHTGPLSGMRLLAAGVGSVILGRFDAEQTLRAIDQHQTATAVMVPTHLNRLLALPRKVRDRYDVSSMVTVALTGSKLPVEVMDAMIAWWGPIFTDAYGATEVGTICAINSREWLEHRGSVGRPLPGFTAHVVDADLHERPVGDEGLLFFRDSSGRGIVYPNDPQKTAEANPEPGFFTLGEIGFVDDDGYVYITDRASDMVVSGGVNLYPAEVEQILIDHPEVADVACIGVPNDDMGEELRALIIPVHPDAAPSFDDLTLWLRARLTPQKCPRSWDVVETLLRNTMGKINKRHLRDAYLAGSISSSQP